MAQSKFVIQFLSDYWLISAHCIDLTKARKFQARDVSARCALINCTNKLKILFVEVAVFYVSQIFIRIEHSKVLSPFAVYKLILMITCVWLFRVLIFVLLMSFSLLSFLICTVRSVWYFVIFELFFFDFLCIALNCNFFFFCIIYHKACCLRAG